MKCPLLLITLLYACGILAGARFEPPLTPLLATTIVLGLATLLFQRARFLLLGMFVFAVGCTGIVRLTAILSPHDLRITTPQEPLLVTIRGPLIAPPQEKQETQEDTTRWRTHVTLKVTALKRYQGEWEPAHGRLRATMPGRLPERFNQGREVEVFGVLRPPSPAAAPGLFDYKAFLRWRQIYRTLTTQSPHDWSLPGAAAESSFAQPWQQRFQNWAREALAHGLPEQDTAIKLLYAMTLGWRAALHGEVAEPFMQSGTMHIFAISGLHIALLSGLVVVLLEGVGIRLNFATLLVLPLLWGYAMVTGWQPSATRAAIMITVLFLGKTLCRPSNLLNSVLAAAFILLLWNPSELFHVGFQLSFCVVLTLACVLPLFDGRVRELGRPDPLLPPDHVPWWRYRITQGVQWIAKSFTTSTAAWLGAAPIIAYYFNLITPVSLLANLVIVPLSGLALMSVLASWVTYPLLPGLTALFNHSAWLWMSGMITVSEWAADLPAAFFHIQSPPPALVGAYYVLLFSIGCCPLYKAYLRRIKPRKVLLTAVASLGLAGTLTLAADAARPQPKSRLTVLPLQGGHAVLCDAANPKHDLLIDCGNASAAHHVTLPYLQRQGYNRLPKLLLTHGDIRHTGGAQFLSQSIPIDEHLTSHESFRSSAYRDWMATLEEHKAPRRRLEAGDSISGWQVLHPKRNERASRADDKAVVLYRELHGQHTLLLSDLGQPGQRLLMERHPTLRADIVVTGLPRQGEPIRPYLLDRLDPDLIVVCSSLFPATERASDKLRARLNRRAVPVYYTEETGGLTFIASPSRWHLKNSQEILWQTTPR